VDKANVLESSRMWREVVAQVAERFPQVPWNTELVDSCAMHLVQDPGRYGVILTENLFGDILSDLGAGTLGSLGLLPSASLGDGGPGLFEPVHGSAPDIAGRHVANPIAMVLSIVLLLEHLGETAWASRLEAAVARIAREGPWTPDWGGDASTEAVGRALAVALEQSE